MSSDRCLHHCVQQSSCHLGKHCPLAFSTLVLQLPGRSSARFCVNQTVGQLHLLLKATAKWCLHLYIASLQGNGNAGCCIATDSWTNIRRKQIMAFMAISSKRQVGDNGCCVAATCCCCCCCCYLCYAAICSSRCCYHLLFLLLLLLLLLLLVIIYP